MEIKPVSVALHSTLIGQLDSPQNVEVRARVEGFVDQFSFEEGREVEKGQILFRLDKKPFEERLAAAKGMLAEAEAALNKYHKDVERYSALFEKRAVPEQDLDNAEASVQVGEASVETARARVQSAELDLSYCDIAAPTSGLIGAKQVSIGELVGKGEPTLLATISTLDPIWFYCNISEVEYLNGVAKGRQTGKKFEDVPLTLILPDGNEHPEKGKLVFIDRAVDTKTGTLRFRAEFPNKAKLLRPGMFARVRADLGAKPETLTVPIRALLEIQGKSFVWILGNDGKVTQRPVVTGDTVEGSVVVNQGLKAGETIIVEGINKLREGIPVSTTTTSASEASEQPSGN